MADKPKRWVACPIEEDYFGDDRKVNKAERKRLSAKDRSKYKKTDQKKREKPTPPEGNLLRGRVLSIISQEIIVDFEGESIVCVLRGALKKEKTRLKNLVTVGDFVLFEKISEVEGAIAYVEPRKSILSRADNLSRRKEQLIAANIDQVLITVSVLSPPLKPPLIDRYIIAATQGSMQPVIVVNKIDLLQDPQIEKEMLAEEKKLLHILEKVYPSLGVPVIKVSANKRRGLNALKKAMKDKASVFSGQSGVGKSSLINELTGRDLPTGDVVERTRKGAHVTTTAQLLRLKWGGWCIDTPGIKSFGLWDLKKEELIHHFTEIHACGEGCKYPNCTHLVEPECSVIDAVANGRISSIRYESYKSLMQTIDEKHLRR